MHAHTHEKRQEHYKPVQTLTHTHTHTSILSQLTVPRLHVQIRVHVLTHTQTHVQKHLQAHTHTHKRIYTQSQTYLRSKEAVVGFSARLARPLKSWTVKSLTSSLQRDGAHQRQQRRTITQKVPESTSHGQPGLSRTRDRTPIPFQDRCLSPEQEKKTHKTENKGTKKWTKPAL